MTLRFVNTDHLEKEREATARAPKAMVATCFGPPQIRSSRSARAGSAAVVGRSLDGRDSVQFGATKRNFGSAEMGG